MKKILLLVLLLWLSACTTPIDLNQNASPTAQDDATTAVPPTPTLTNQPIVSVPKGTIIPADTAVPSTSPPPATETPPTRIQFDPGDTSTTISSSLETLQSIEFLAWGAVGQQMDVELSSTNNGANFAVTGMSDGQPYKRVVNEDRFWSQTLPLTQDYLIVITALEAIDFTLTLTIYNLEEALLQPVWPIVDGASGFVLGGSHNGQWLDASMVMPSLQDTGRTYQLYANSQLLGQIDGTTPFVSEFGPCADLPQVGFPAAADLSNTVAFISSWNPIPRPTEPLPLNTPVYQEAVAEYLQANGIADPDVQINRIDKIDFEGDGVYEILISASRLSGLDSGLPTAAAGDYSVVLLRKIVNGTLETFTLAESLFPEAVELADPVQFNIMAFLDLNGNGKLELVLENDSYEARFVTIHEINQQEVNRVLIAGCGL